MYETPSITELGSVADFTRGDQFAWEWDSAFPSHSHHMAGETPTS
jgi:hypothetical protein